MTENINRSGNVNKSKIENEEATNIRQPQFGTNTACISCVNPEIANVFDVNGYDQDTEGNHIH